VAILTGKPGDFDRVMTDGSRSLLDAARDAGVSRFVQMSALGTSEATKDTVPYYRAKWAIEEAVRSSGLGYAIWYAAMRGLTAAQAAIAKTPPQSAAGMPTAALALLARCPTIPKPTESP